MAFFGSKKTEVSEDNIRSATIITQGSKFVGDITSSDSIHIDGEVVGNIIVNNILIISKSGKIEGNIKANKIICSGSIDGDIECSSFELMSDSSINSRLKSQTAIINGKLIGEIVALKVLIDTKGAVSNLIQAKEVVVKGEFRGDVSCELLTTKVTGRIKGNMFVKNISNEGGMVEGSIGQYKEIVVEKEDNAKEKEIIEVDNIENKEEEKVEEEKKS